MVLINSFFLPESLIHSVSYSWVPKLVIPPSYYTSHQVWGYERLRLLLSLFRACSNCQATCFLRYISVGIWCCNFHMLEACQCICSVYKASFPSSCTSNFWDWKDGNHTQKTEQLQAVHHMQLRETCDFWCCDYQWVLRNESHTQPFCLTARQRRSILTYAIILNTDTWN